MASPFELGNYGQPPAAAVATTAPSLGDIKQQQVAEALQIKQAQLDPAYAAKQAYNADLASMDTTQLRAKYGPSSVLDKMNYDLGARASQQIDSIDRTAPQVVNDAGASVAKGTTGLLGGIFGLAQQAGQGMAVLGQNWSNPEQATANLKAVELGNARTAAAFNKGLNSVNDAITAQESQRSQLADWRTGLTMQADQEANQKQYEQDVANGENPMFASLAQLGRGVVQGGADVLRDPTYAGNFLAEQVPSLAIGPISKAAAVKSLTAGMTRAEATGFLASEAGKEAVEKAGTRNLMAGIGLTEGTGAGQQTFDQVDQTPLEDLQKNSPQFRDLVSQGYSPEDARSVLAQRSAGVAMAIQGPAAALTGRIAAKFELDPLGSSGATSAARVTHALSSIGKETVEETIQSGAGQAAQNVGIQTMADPTQSLTEGVGEQAGMGALGAVGLSGLAQTPAATAGALKATANVSLAAAKGSVAKAQEGLQKAAQARTALNPEDQQAADQQASSESLRTAASEYDLSAGRGSAETNDQSDERGAAPNVTTEAPSAETTPPPSNRLQTMVNLHANVMDDTKSPQERAASVMQAVQLQQTMIQEYDQLEAAQQAGNDSADIQQRKEAIEKAFNSPESVQLAQVYEKMKASQEQLNQANETIPDTVETATPEMQQSAQDVYSAAVGSKPEDVPAPLYQKVLANSQQLGLTPQQTAVIQGAAKVSQLVANNKGMDLVNNDVTEGNNADFVSLKQHVRNFYGALADNDTGLAQHSLNQLGNFAQHMAQKSQAFNDAMVEFQNSDQTKPFNVTNPITGTAYRSLTPDGKRGGPKMMEVSNKSHRLIPQIHAEASLLADTYNQMAADHPEFQAPEIKVAPLTFNQRNQAPAQPAPARTEPAATGNEIRIGDRVLTRAELQDLASGEVTPADLKAKWAAETAPATQEQVEQPAPVETPAPTSEARTEAPVEPEAPVVDNATQNLDNADVTDNTAEPVPANQEPVTPTTAPTEETQDEPAQSPEPVDSGVATDSNVEPSAPVQTGVERLFANLTPEINRTKKDSESDIDHEDRNTNVVLKYFSPAKGKSLFTRSADIVSQLGTMTAEQVGELFKTPTPVSEDQMRGIQSLLAINNGIRQAYTEALQSKLAKVKADNIPWRNIPILYFSRIGTNNGRVGAQISRHVTDAIGLATVKFAMDNLRAPTYTSRDDLASDLGIQTGQLTQELVDKFMTGSQAYSVVAERLAASISRTIGLKANPDAPGNIANGIPLSLALDAMGVMERLGLAKVESAKLNLGTEKKPVWTTFKSITFERGTDEDLTVLGTLEKQLGNQLDIMSKLIDPDSKASAYVDSTPPVGSDQLGRSFTQKLSTRLKDAVRNLQKKPFYLNTDLHDLYEGLGVDVMRQIMGYASVDNLNKIHAESVKGKNVSINSAINAWQAGMDDLRAAAGERELGSVPVRFNWKIGSNMRAMMDSSTFNPQRHKLHREMMTGEPVTLDVTNEKHMHEFQMAMAQALGTKVDRMSNDAAKAELEKALATPAIRTAVDILKAHLGDYSNLQAGDAQAIGDAVAQAGEGMKSFHALLAQAKMEHAQENGYNKFSNHLTFELDGKTDGPANALVHFGSTAVGQKFIGLLKKVGLFVNDNSTALNVYSGTDTDIYQTVSGEINNQLRMMAAEGNVNMEPLQDQAILLRLAGNMKYADIDDLNTFEATRNMAKNPVTQTVYSAGDQAKIRSLRTQIQDAVYEQLSNAIQNQTTLAPEVLKAIVNMSGATELNNPESYKNFEFTNAHNEAMDEKLTMGMGGLLNTAISSVLGNVVASGQTLAKAAAIQHALFNAAYTQAREDKVKELREAGQLASYNDLSNEQLQEVFDSVSHLAPIYHNALTSGTNAREGMLMSDETRVDTNANAESIFGGGTAIKTQGYAAPGARPAPMMTISSGDATMMALYFLKHSDALNVFDGLEVMPGSFDSAAKGINDAVFQGWQFDLLKGISDSFNSATQIDPSFFGPLSMEKVNQMAQLMNIPAKELKGRNREGIIALLNDRIVTQGMELEQLGRITQAVKSVMFNELPTSTDHMAGNQTPVINRGDRPIVDNLEQFMQERVQAHMDRQQRAEDLQQSAPDTAIDRHLANVKAPDASGVTQYGKADIVKAMTAYLDEVGGKAARVPQFVLAQIAKSLPEDLTVHVGTKASIAQHITEQFPDIGLEPNARMQGMTYGSQVFIANRSAETIMHELVHAATQRMLNQYFADGTKLSTEQRNSITALNRLMNDFIGAGDVDLNTVAFGRQSDIRTYVQSLIAGNNRAQALNEFVAWSLTNPQLAQSLLDTPNENKSTHILGKIIGFIQKLLGIGKRGQSYFESIAGHVMQTMMSPADQTDGIAEPLNQLDLQGLYDRLRSERTSPDHQAHLDSLFTYLNNNLVSQINQTQQPVAGITTAADQLNMDSIDPTISAVADGFIASGFDMNDQEKMLFKMLQATLQSNFEANPAKAIEVRKLFNEAADKLTSADFVDATGSTSLASQRYNALFGDGQPGNEQLANFLATSQTNQMLRDKLRDMFTAKASNKSQDWETRITKMVDDGMRWVANLGTGIKRSSEMQKRLDNLTRNITHFQAEARQNAIEKATSGIGDSLEQLNNMATQRVSQTGAWIERNADALASKVPTQTGEAAANFMLRSIAALSNKDASGRLAEATLSTLNQGNKTPMGALRSLVVEMIGITDSNRSVLELVGRAKTTIDKFRQTMREQVPAIVNGRFSQELTPEESTALHTALGKTDAQSLLNNGYTHADVAKLFTDPTYLNQEISAAEQGMQSAAYPAVQINMVKALAHFMVTGEVSNRHLLVNASQIAFMQGTGYRVTETQAKASIPAIDKLATLYAIRETPAAYQTAAQDVINREMAANPADNGVTFSLNYLQSLVQRETPSYAAIKGAMHTSYDSRKSVIIADAKQGADLIRRGYIKGNPAPLQNIPGQYHYYESSEGGRPQWNQGAMQTVQSTSGGTDAYTGRMRSPITAPYQTGVMRVRNIRSALQPAIKNGTAFRPNGFTMNPRPVYDADGKHVGYEYSVPHAERDARMQANNDFAKSVAAWEGRIAEEQLSRAFNQKLVTELNNRYVEDTKTVGREQEYVDITDKSSDPQVREMYSLMPREMKEDVQTLFKGGVLKVRKDMLDNAMGHRQASVKEIWDGNSRLAAPVQSAVRATAEVLMGNKAARWLRKAERFQMEAVSAAKDMIVVRSLVVARDNIISNITQVMGHGMNPVKFVRKSAEAMVLADAYTKNEKRINHLGLLLQNQADTAKHSAYRREIESLRAENARSPVHPLMMAGHLPTIAEGLSENDDHSMRNDFSDWINAQVSKLPSGLTTAAKYALLSRGTPLYAGLNRMIQYGDFTAKYALHDHLVNNQKMSQADAMKVLEDEFVNYSLLPSRARDWNERMGFTWFLNYKLRIQKIILRSIRDNPLRFMAIAGGMNAVDIPNILDANLVTHSLSPNLGMSPLFRAHEMHPLWWLVD